MFTGIVEELGNVVGLEPHATGARLTIACSAVLRDVTLGASIAVNGACLTAVEIEADRFAAELAPETLKRTNLGKLRAEAPVNLERPLFANSRLDGHFVLGHVDGTATILKLDLIGNDNWWLTIEAPEELCRYVVSKGSIAVDGISLTVAEIQGTHISFTIIPHTYEHTTLRGYKAGDIVNLEVDIMAKHIEKLLGKAKN
jgi:riboflavin synthase